MCNDVNGGLMPSDSTKGLYCLPVAMRPRRLQVLANTDAGTKELTTVELRTKIQQIVPALLTAVFANSN